MKLVNNSNINNAKINKITDLKRASRVSDVSVLKAQICADTPNNRAKITTINQLSLIALLLFLGVSSSDILAKPKNKQANKSNKNSVSNSKVKTAPVTKSVGAQVQAAPENNLKTDVPAPVSVSTNNTAGSKTNAQTSAPINSANNNTSDQVLLSMAGKPVLTIQEFDNFLTEVANSNPQVGFALQSPYYPDPVGVKKSLFDEKVRFVVMGEWAKTSGIRNSEKYKADERKMLEQVRMWLDEQSFIQEHKVDVSDADVQAYYEKNKNTDRRLLLSPAGIEVKAVLFEKDQQAKADEFANKLKNNTQETIESLAKSSDLDVSHLGIINSDSSNIMPEIKDVILGMQKFPQVAVVKCEDDFWVILASGKVDAKYRPLDQVKDNLRELLRPEKTKQMFDTELPKLAQNFKIIENKQYFEELKQKQVAKQAQEGLIDLAESNDIGNDLGDDLSNLDDLDGIDDLDSSGLMEDIELEIQP